MSHTGRFNRNLNDLIRDSKPVRWSFPLSQSKTPPWTTEQPLYGDVVEGSGFTIEKDHSPLGRDVRVSQTPPPLRMS